MPVSADFAEFVKDQLAGFGPIEMRRLFGGAGLFRGGRMFALLHGDTLYFKAGAGNRAAFDAAGAPPFSYRRGGEAATIASYREVPPAVLDDADALRDWAEGAWAAALDAPVKRGKPRPTKRGAKKRA